jgi:hypothetical protein
MFSSNRLEPVITSMRRQRAIILLIVIILAGYGIFLASMRWSSVSVVTQFYERMPAKASKILAPVQLPVAMDLTGTVPWERLALIGFSAPEPWGIWTRQPVAEMLLVIDGLGDADLLLTVKGIAFLHERHPRQRVHVRVNGEAVADWSYVRGDASNMRETVIPAAVAKAQTPLRITFDMPDARAPLDLGLSSDPRPLGVGLIGLRIEPLPARPTAP